MAHYTMDGAAPSGVTLRQPVQDVTDCASDPNVLMLGRFVPAWPNKDPRRPLRAPKWSLARAMTRPFKRDTHFAAYDAVAPYRLNTTVLERQMLEVRMRLAVFDVDDATSHASGAPASDGWRAVQQPKFERLLTEHPGGFVYATRGGARIVYVLDPPVVLVTAADGENWKKRYLCWCEYLYQRFAIVADRSCKDWTRLHRCPHATREGSASPEDRETIGDPQCVGAWVLPKDWELATCGIANGQRGPRYHPRDHVPCTQRHGDAVSFAGRLRRGGFDPGFIFQLLRERRDSHYEDPGSMPDGELADLAEWIEAKEPEESGDRIEPYSPLDLDGEPEPITWILENWIPDRSIVLLCGGTGEGKSTVLGAQAISITAGIAPWNGGKAEVAVRPTVYLDAEMGANATRRMFRRLRDGFGLERTPVGLVVCSDPGGISLLTAEGRQRIEVTLKTAADRHGSAPVLILDTLSAVLAGLESFNDAALVEPIYAHLFRWRDELGVTVILGHHPRKRSRGESGPPTLDQVRDSTTHVGKCSDVLFGRKPTPDAPYLDVYTLKCRGRDPVSVQRIGYESDGQGQPIVLSLLDAPQPADDPQVLKAQGLSMSFLRENGGTCKRNAIVEHLMSLGVSERTVDRALESLLTLGAASKPKRGIYSIHTQSSLLDEERG